MGGQHTVWIFHKNKQQLPHPSYDADVQQQWMEKDITKKLLLQHKQIFLPCRFGSPSVSTRDLHYQRPSSCSVLLPVLAMTEMWHGKKSAVHVAQHIAAKSRFKDRRPSFWIYTTSLRTGRRTEQAFSNEGLWKKPKCQGKNVWLCWSNCYFSNN